MGHKDLDSLHKIYREVQALNKKYFWYFAFKVDDGSYETRIDVNDNGDTFLGNGRLPLIGYEMFCPDLMEWNRKLIIEFEEEASSNTGFMKAKKHKGHTEYTNTRDTRRDNHYRKFTLLKIWKKDLKSDIWKRKLQSFLWLAWLYPITPL